jgi:hypothetical protein
VPSDIDYSDNHLTWTAMPHKKPKQRLNVVQIHIESKNFMHLFAKSERTSALTSVFSDSILRKRKQSLQVQAQKRVQKQSI